VQQRKEIQEVLWTLTSCAFMKFTIVDFKSRQADEVEHRARTATNIEQSSKLLDGYNGKTLKSSCL